MSHFDIAVIGTGSGNSILDERYADKRVAICEQGVFGGTCLNVGCIPTKMFVYAAEVAQSARESAQYGVDAHVDGVRWADIVSRVFGRIDPIAMGGENYRRSSPNVEVFASHTRFRPTLARRTLRAAHRRRRRVHRRPGGHRGRITRHGSRRRSPNAVCRTTPATPSCGSSTCPSDLIIVGGGFIACEFAHVFSALGSHVTLMIRGSTLLRGHDDDICDAVHRHRLQEVGDPQPPRVVRRSGGRRWRRDRAAKTARRCAATHCWWPPGRMPNGDLLDAEQAGVKVTARRPGRRRRVPTHHPRVAFSRSVTCRRTTSSSTWPTTRRGW